MFLRNDLFIVLLLVISLSLIAPFVYSQNPKIDSLKKELHHVEGKEKVYLLLEIADCFSNIDLSASLKYSYEAFGIAESLDQDYLIFKCSQSLGKHYLAKGNLDESLQHLMFALNTLEDQKNKEDFTHIFNNLGTIYSRKGLLDSALYYHESALKLSIEEKDSLNQISSLRSIGNVYYNKGDFDQALSQFRAGLSLAELFHMAIEEESHLYNNLGVLYSDWGEYDLSLAYYKKALHIVDSLQKHSDIGRILNNIGNIYWYKENYDSALIFYNKSLNKREDIGDLNGKAYVLNNLGMIYGSMEQYEKSLEYFKHSLNLFDEILNRGGVVMTTYNTAYVYIELKDYENARKYLNQGLIIAQEQGYKDYITANLDALAQLYENTEDWENAFNTLEKYKILNDSIRAHKNMEIIRELEIKYENEKYKADLAILKNQNDLERAKKNQNLIIFIGVVIVILLIILSTYLLITRMKITTANEYNKLTPALLRYQLNPEFINSSLSGIKELVSKNRVKESGLFLSGFAKLMRTFIETSTNNAIILEKELDTIQQFIHLHQLRYEYEIHFEKNIDEQIEIDMIAIPPLIIFPVFVHFIDNYLFDGKLNIQLIITYHNSKLMINAQFDYATTKNIKQDQKELKKIIGSIQNRIKSINKTYKEDISLKYKMDSQKKRSLLDFSILFPIKPL